MRVGVSVGAIAILGLLAFVIRQRGRKNDEVALAETPSPALIEAHTPRMPLVSFRRSQLATGTSYLTALSHNIRTMEGEIFILPSLQRSGFDILYKRERVY